jgi:TRAP-type mannitol/chloroaromatic compound transport system substrate-binding protein
MNDRIAEQLAQTCWDLRAKIAADARVEEFKEAHLQQCEQMRNKYYEERNAAQEEVKRLRKAINRIANRLNRWNNSEIGFGFVEEVVAELKAEAKKNAPKC